jgi:DNA primase
MKQIPDEFLEQVRAIPIVEVAEQYFDLKRNGSVLQTSCIHGGDRDPSLTFFEPTNTFYCFGCGAGKKPKTDGSNVISFVMWMDNCTFMEAVTKLSAMKGWVVPRKGLSAADRQKQIMLEQVLKDNRTYWNALQGNEDYIQYLADRGIDKDDINKWRIGYSHKASRERFASRLVFSLMNDWGQTVGFSFRNMSDQFEDVEDDGPKYINSPQSEIFDKGSTLYGLNFVRRQIREKGYVIIGEGFGDTILGQKLELPMVSIMGTSLTDKQIEILKKYTDTVILWLDGDGGGIGATTRHARALRKAGFIVKVINYLGKDPDDIFLDAINGLEPKEAIAYAQQLVETQAVMASQFDIQQALSQFDSVVMEHKLRTVRSIKPIIDELDNKAEYEVFLEQIAKRLDVSIQTLID